MSNTHDISRDQWMLKGELESCGYDWWWHSFTGHDAETGKEELIDEVDAGHIGCEYGEYE